MSQTLSQASSFFAPGYSSLEQEVVLDRLPVSGTIPHWLEGSLLRNGPAKFEMGQQNFRHWFDGFGMLHRFTFQQGQISYANKFLRSDSYVQSMEEGRIVGSSFGTDPCKAVFKKTQSVLINTNVSVDQMVGQFVAMTESPIPVRFDPHTLDTLGVVEYDDRLTGHHGCAHPHHDGTARILSFMTEFGPQCEFKVFAIENDSAPHRTPIGSYPVTMPPYIHSFSISEHYIIIAEYPYRLNPLSLQSGKAYVENLQWLPEEGARFVVMDKQDGSIVRIFSTDAFFCFHHINSFEQDGDIFVDLVAYSDATIVKGLYLDQLRGISQEIPTQQPSEFRRYHLPLSSKTEVASYEHITNARIELPTINYQSYNARDYSIAYGVCTDWEHPEVVSNQLVRIDARQKKALTWSEEGCYPGEPIFVEAPEARAEDDGVVLSVVLNGKKGNSFLLVLDAHTFHEIGRAEVPHHIPFGFHGLFFPGIH
ncbi:carotenoid oxygenase family protein [Ktedonospora formicarum]|uniref:15,15' beta carotene dioxygenase n=1 Tax=Ktedonospora formicarum TaxID=2778364 RepID=A0A8J3MRQ5_9CHLR|nr:carotenoid oxygenase family protein [Ktedonospora formicarum]GHO46362.1 15,15' beta carotene dioxygenase [Ktedonospora formicarum]